MLENVDFKMDFQIRKASIEKGVYYISIACKQSSVSYSHSESDIDFTLEVTRQVLQGI